MKVLRDTPDQLILDETPWFWGIMLTLFTLVFVGVGMLVLPRTLAGGLAFIIFGGGLGLVAMVVFVHRVQVILDRVAGTLTLRRKSLLRQSEVVHALDHLHGAEIEETRSDNNQTLSRPVLILDGGMSAGRHPVVSAYSSGTMAQRMADSINTWLEQSPRV